MAKREIERALRKKGIVAEHIAWGWQVTPEEMVPCWDIHLTLVDADKFGVDRYQEFENTALAVEWANGLEPYEPTFQERVSDWMGECFLPSLYSNMTERGDRLLEEVLELLQSKGYDRSRVATLVDYVYGRPPGEPSQEVGGVMVTLGGYCWVAGLDMHADGERELARINQPEVMAKIRAKQEAKNALHFDTPLPGNAPEDPHA